MSAQGQITTNPFALSAEAALMTKPEIQQRVYADKAARYNQLTTIINRMNGYKDVPTDNTEYFWAVSPPATKAYRTSSNSTLLSNGNLEVNIQIPTGGDNFYRVTEVVQDNNGVQGYIVGKNTTTIEIMPIPNGSGTVTAFNASTNFTSGMTVKIIGNAQQYAGSRNLETIVYTTTEDSNFTQIRREGITFGRKDLYLKTWYTNRNGRMWNDFDLQMVMERYNRRDETTLWNGKKGIIGTPGARTTVYFSDGIKNRIYTKNSQLYRVLPAEMTEADLQDFIQTYKNTTRITRLICLCGSQFLANLQANIIKQYITTAGDTNTFDVTKGLNGIRYTFLGVTVEFIEWDLFNDPEDLYNISTITGKPKESSSAFFFSPDPIMDSTGMGTLPPFVCRYIGRQKMLAGFIRGMVDWSAVTPDMIYNSDIMGNTFMSDVDEVTFAAYGDYSYQIEPQNFGFIGLSN